MCLLQSLKWSYACNTAVTFVIATLLLPLSLQHQMFLRQALVSMATMITELMSSKGADLGQQQRIIARLQSQLHAFCADMLHHMQVSTSLSLFLAVLCF